MNIEEKCQRLVEIFKEDFRGNLVALAEEDTTWHHGVTLRLKKHEFHPLDALHFSSTFEKIYGELKLIFVALSRYDDRIIITMVDANNLRYCDKDGTRWGETKYRAICPLCKEPQSELVKFNPNDFRDLKCIKCHRSSRVRSYFTIDQTSSKV